MDNTNNQSRTGGKAALFRAIRQSRAGMEAACRAVDIPRAALCEESMIAAARFREVTNRVGQALQACLDAEVALRSFVAVFGDELLAIDEDADGEAAE